MGTEQRDNWPTLSPDERKQLQDLFQLVVDLKDMVDGLEDTVHYLRQDVNAKAEGNHTHSDLERQIRDTEYHNHHEYAVARHTHDRWDLR